LLEGSRLQVADVDSARMLWHIHGKNKQDRYVPLPKPTLELLRAHWCTHHSLWLFPAPTRHGLAHSLALSSARASAGNGWRALRRR
jgi:integrase